MKKYIASFLIIALVLLFTGCNEKVDNTEPTSTTPAAADSGGTQTPNSDSNENENKTHTFGSADVPEVWETIYGAFARDDSSQYNNAVLMMKYLSNGCVMFEFRLMEGSESEDFAFDTIVPGILIVDDNGIGFYETIPDAENLFSINFVLSEDGKTVDVTHDGELLISPDGRYNFTEAYVEVSESSAGAILEHLPTAATSLNSNLGAYTINYPDSLISDWFYSVEAVFDDSGATLAKFLIAKDLSAVFRADDDIEPVLIFGSAQPMMDAYIMIMEKVDFSSAEDSGEDEHESPEYESRTLVAVTLDNGVYLMPGMSGLLKAVIPGDLPYILTAESLDETVATVDETGMVRAVGEGETAIQCTIMCEDGTAQIGIYIYVTDELEYDDVTPE